MPISNADNPSERFPKELTRRLLPASGDGNQAQKVSTAVNLDQGNGGMPHPPPPPASGPPNITPGSSFSERERPSHLSNSFTSAIEDDDIRSATVLPIERERKPYTAREGGGKVHEETRGMPAGIKVENNGRPTRANSTATHSQSNYHPTNRPIDISNSVPRSHRLSMNGPPSSMRYGSSPATHGQTPYTRSEGTNIGDIPPAYYASNMVDHEDLPAPRDPRRTFRRQNTEDETRNGGASRGIPVPGYNNGTSGSYDPRTYAPQQDGYSNFSSHTQPHHLSRY